MAHEQARKVPFSLSMLGWALNEEENLEGYIDRAGRFLADVTDDYELVLIDDGSTDRTLEIAHACQLTRPWLRVYSNGSNRGSGYNTKRALALAQKDYVFWQTVDWSYDITLLGQNLHLLHEHDVLQGVRLDTLSLGGLARRSDNLRKAIISTVNYLLVRVLFRLPLHDYQNVTVYPRRLIQSVALESESAFTNPECLLKAWWKGASIHEVPVPFLKRQRGTAKGTRLATVWRSLRDVVSWWFRWVVLGKRPDRGRGRVTYWSGPAPAAAECPEAGGRAAA
ncbi:MAG TPA: glycosyltransferase family 2 protein [Gemmataceae bacterium]|nr:glycosyltransferase family 2 protein [Gemmataceae bacterium]